MTDTTDDKGPDKYSHKYALLDGDVLRYEVGAIGQGTEDHPDPMPFDYVAGVLDDKIANITALAQAREPVIYLTGAVNFRDNIAVTKPYKGNRKGEKPFHFKNLTAYLRGRYNVVETEGLEADDRMAYDQFNSEADSTIICTRDKDLRMIPGWHYGWECGAQREYSRRLVDHDGYICELQNGKVEATGMALFWYQMLIGDTVDNIPGCPGIGPKKAFKLLDGCPASDMWGVVREVYYEKGMTDEYILEQGQLLWMTRELHPDGSPVLWQLPD